MNLCESFKGSRGSLPQEEEEMHSEAWPLLGEGIREVRHYEFESQKLTRY